MIELTEAQKTWHAKYEYFKDFENYQGWEHMRDFTALVAQIRDSPYSALVYASTSHESLCLSLYGNFPERREHPIVVVTPRKVYLKVEYWQHQHHKLEKIECSYENAWEVIVRMIERLLQTTAQ